MQLFKRSIQRYKVIIFDIFRNIDDLHHFLLRLSYVVYRTRKLTGTAYSLCFTVEVCPTRQLARVDLGLY